MPINSVHLTNHDDSVFGIKSRSILHFSDVCNADLSSYSAQCVAGVLKKFLRELPDPVIPVQFYDRFIEASSEYYINEY